MDLLVNANFKKCIKCGEVKPITEFHKNVTSRDGLSGVCKICKRLYRISPEYQAREKELEKTPHWRERKRRYYTTLHGRIQRKTEQHRQRSDLPSKNHKLALDEWLYIIKQQNSSCAICGIKADSPFSLVTDCIIPISKGGSFTFHNVQALCLHCNAVKNTKSYSGLIGNRWRSLLVVDI